MEIFVIALVVVFIAAAVYYNRKSKNFDINQDGKVSTADIKAAVQNAVCGAEKDVAKAKKTVKAAAGKAKAATKKTKKAS
jgi:hypothetical protein